MELVIPAENALAFVAGVLVLIAIALGLLVSRGKQRTQEGKRPR